MRTSILVIASLTVLLGAASLPGSPVLFRRGDSNTDGKVDISDGINTLGYLFLGGRELPCLDAADANDSGGTDLSDGVFTFGYLPAAGPRLEVAVLTGFLRPEAGLR